MVESRMIQSLVLLLALQEAPLEREKERIRAKVPLTQDEMKSYSFPAAPPLKPRASYSLCAIPAPRPSDDSVRRM